MYILFKGTDSKSTNGQNLKAFDDYTANLRCGWSCQAISVTSVTLYSPCVERIRCMKSQQLFSHLTRPAGMTGSCASPSRIPLTALRAFQKHPKTTVLQSSPTIIIIILVINTWIKNVHFECYISSCALGSVQNPSVFMAGLPGFASHGSSLPMSSGNSGSSWMLQANSTLWCSC